MRPTLKQLGFDEVRHVDRGEDAKSEVLARPPVLALVDLGLPDRSGLSVGQDILRNSAETKVVILTALNDQRTVRRALLAGFHGYITKDTPVATFGASIRSVLRGQTIFPNGYDNGRSRKSGAGDAEDGAGDAQLLAGQLTSREREVLSLLVQGMSGEEIADALGISPNTVRTHVQSILTKLQVHSRLEAATFAVRHGVVGPSRRQVS